MRANPILRLLIALLLIAAPASAGVFRPASKNGIPDVYMVVLEDGVVAKPGRPAGGLPTVAAVARDLGGAHGGTVQEVWEYVSAFGVRMPEARARRLAKDPRVKAVEQELLLSAPVTDCYLATGGWIDERPLKSPAAPGSHTLECDQADPLEDDPLSDDPPLCRDNWGLDRIDQIDRERDEVYSFPNNGTQVHVYVLDSGVNWHHREFLDAEGNTRVSGGIDITTTFTPIPGTAENTQDCTGHGTHVAATIAGRTFGVAKAALIHPVYIGGCGDRVGTAEGRLVRGLNWIAGNAQRPAVVNWSGGNTESVVGHETLRNAVRAVLAQGITVVQAAGNQSRVGGLKDACELSMGGVIPEVVVVAGMDYNEGRWSRRPEEDEREKFWCTQTKSDCGSNVGSCVDIWAPSAHILAANYRGNDLTCQLSGTSMAAPHVTGVVALYLQNHPTATPAQVEQALRSLGTWGKLQSIESNPNYIGRDSDNVLVFADTLGTGNPAPTASFTRSCPGRQCKFDATASTDPGGAITEYFWRFSDGHEETGSSVVRVFPANSSNSVVLRVKDNSSPIARTDHLQEKFTVNANAPPIAAFDGECDGLVCTFDSTSSTDAGGSIATRTWKFGDNDEGSGVIVTHTYDAPGTYTVELTVTDNVGQTDDTSEAFNVVANLAAPANVIATASGSLVTISWTLTSGATEYDIDRMRSTQVWERAKTVSGASASTTTDTPPSSSNGVVLYRVVARAGANSSVPSNADAAFVGTFTDGSIAGAPVRTVLKAVHITEMRTAVNGLRALNGDPALYTGPALDPAPLRDKEFIEDTEWLTLMQNLNAARGALSLPAIPWRTTPGDGLFLRTQIEDLRLGVQ
ncbi:MAG TPA: PKD domain-containing protein [Thermoanaerobaculia bacterium]|nr:PKD domain-containing protein [Thermoanaerobaculia bacterium]